MAKDVVKKAISPALITKLRDAVSPKGKKALWLRDLSNDQLLEIYGRMRLSNTFESIIEIVRDKWGVGLGLSYDGMYHGLKKFRERVVPEMTLVPKKGKLDPDESRIRSRVIHQSRELKKKLDGLEVIATIICEEMDSYQLYKDKEALYGYPLKSRQKCAEGIVNYANIFIKRQMDMGIIDSTASDMVKAMRDKFGAILGGFTDGGRVMLMATNKFLELAEGETVELEENPEGQFVSKETK
jgi:hypothetical protein